MTATVYAQVAPGRWVGMRGSWSPGEFTCSLCPVRRFHSRDEHRALVKAIRHPLQPEVWGEDDYEVVSRGHHPPERFLAAAQEDGDVAWALDLTDTDSDALKVEHTWRRYVPRSRWDDGERVGAWWPAGAGTPGACPFTVAALP